MSDWIKHDGTTMPVSGSTIVHLRFEDGDVFGPDAASEWHHPNPRNSHWCWDKNDMHGHEIGAYRVAERSV